MTAQADDTAQRLQIGGWQQTALSSANQMVELDFIREVLLASECCLHDGTLTNADFIKVVAQSDWTLDGGGVLTHTRTTQPEAISRWTNSAVEGELFLLDFEDEWTCIAFMRVRPNGYGDMLTSAQGGQTDVMIANNVQFLWDMSGPAEKIAFFEIFSFMQPPPLFFAHYVAVDATLLTNQPDIAQPYAFTAEIGAAFGY